MPKISQLPAASTPLAGTELVPVVQAGNTDSVEATYIANTLSILTGTITGTYTLAGAPTIAAPAISNPTLSGTVLGTYTLAGVPSISSPTISNPVLSGTATGTYTLAGTPTVASPTISNPVLSGTATGTYALAGTPSILSPILSGTVTGTYTLAGTPTLASPTISSPVLSGTATGTYALGGTPSLAANLAATGFTVTSGTFSGATLAGTTTLPDGGTITGTGTVLGTATGGAKGSGTLNAQGLYVNGTSINQSPFTAKFSSLGSAIPAAGSTISFAHGLGAKPFGVILLLQCTATNAGYSSGDTVMLPPGILYNGTFFSGFSIYYDATNVNLIMSSQNSVLTIAAKTTGIATQIANGDWNIAVEAWV